MTPVESFVLPRKGDPTSETYGCSEKSIDVRFKVRNTNETRYGRGH
jgi:hypothetical protein